jgi:hypothetical protein
VEIWDDYVVKTQEEVDAILDRLSDIWTAHLQRKRAEALKQASENEKE